MDLYPLYNSIRIAFISTIIIFFMGIFFAYYISKVPNILKGVLDVILTLPLVLPPTVVGYLLLLILGPKHTIGKFFLDTFNIKLVMNWWSAIFSTSIVAFPLMYRTARGAFEAGAVLSFARALGEYGATSMISGYTPGKTATISTTVYQLWSINDETKALYWVIVNILISLIVLLFINNLERRQK